MPTRINFTLNGKDEPFILRKARLKRMTPNLYCLYAVSETFADEYDLFLENLDKLGSGSKFTLSNLGISNENILLLSKTIMSNSGLKEMLGIEYFRKTTSGTMYRKL